MTNKRIRLWGRYTGASVIAGIISELAFVITYWFGATPLVATLVAFVAGAVPNYVMNRYWAWQRSGRPDRNRELLPYAVIVIVTALVAILVTTAADRWVHEHVTVHALQVTLVAGAFLATYGTMFVVKFLIFDRFIFVDRAAGNRESTSAP